MAKSFDRHNMKTSGAVNPGGTLRGENGRKLCRWCGTETQPPRRTFCSDACVHEWNVRANASYARQHVWLRDRGVCAACQVDTCQQSRDLLAEFDAGEYTGLPLDSARRKAMLSRLDGLCISLARWRTSFHTGCWDMDHIVPVVEGGGSCGLDNLRTLCLRCHAHETKRLRRRQKIRRARKRTGCYEIE